ncbi:hypothetical protein GCM10009830_29580 [Glycomyces endophyticus]|uniref:Uncharacterized protein n=1 Tax=Glycomyces endophyticus TaxID=480996 RepID=A0ABN2H1V2_9ACTN
MRPDESRPAGIILAADRRGIKAVRRRDTGMNERGALPAGAPLVSVVDLTNGPLREAVR